MRAAEPRDVEATWRKVGELLDLFSAQECANYLKKTQAMFPYKNSVLSSRAPQIRSPQQRQRGFKLYSFHAPKVERIGKGKASAPYEFGVKASIVTNNRRAPGGPFVLHARPLPDNPYDGHTLRDVLDRTETLTGCAIERAYVDKGYRGHDAQNPLPRLHLRPEAQRLRRHQARAAPSLRH
ncbi:hypothetical protein ACVIHI_000009 [Bradyrhizobium sp. USDA 4524]|nr:hypothetical protein [Bradyrhizobium sp. USDA 4538]MCP1899194.1 hypothetical protein [Bradyrhizobium sp. USDA 4537]MCP1986694.1 hypothetical protein [Bradyrhizobium sp. USDA 4539]